MSPLPMTALLLVFCISLITHGKVVERSGEKQGPSVEGVGTLFQREARSAFQCGVTCMGTPRCIAVTVTSAASLPGSPVTCRGHDRLKSVTATSTPASAVTVLWHLPHPVWLEKKCSSDVDCGGEHHRECFSGSCLCSPGYYFSHGLNSCVTTCVTGDLLPRMLTYPQRAIAGYNMGSCYTATVDKCLADCGNNTNVRTCDLIHQSSDNCCLQAVTKKDVPASAWRVTSTITHYQKTCV